MKRIIFSLLLILVIISTSCSKDELLTANFDLYQVDALTTQTGDEQATISWQPIADSNPEQYFIMWSSGSGEIAGGEIALDPTVTTYKITNLVNDQEYTVSVQARYSDGLSNKISKKITPKTSRLPVKDLVGTAGNTEVELVWKKPSGDNLLKGYQIAYTPGGGMENLNDAEIETYTIQGLNKGVEYTFAVTCMYDNGPSKSETVYVTTGQPINIDGGKVVNNVPTKFSINEGYFTGGVVESVLWNFGGAGTSTELTPLHTYTMPGTYTVSVTATYVGGQSEEGKMVIIVDNYLWSKRLLSYTGLTEWGYVKCSNPVFSPDGRVMYVSTSNKKGNMYTIDVATGTIKWVYELPLTYAGGPVVGGDGVIYQATADKSAYKVYAINPDGTPKWSFDVDAAVGAFPALHNGTLYVLADTNPCKLYAINTSDGTAVWATPIEVTGTKGGAVGVSNTGIVIAATTSTINAFNADGTGAWQQPVTGLNISDRGSFAFGNIGKLYVALASSEANIPAGIVQINVADGNKDWTFGAVVSTTNGNCYYPIVDKNGIIYFSQREGNIYAVKPDGTQKWVQSIGAKMIYTGLALSEDGVVYGATQAAPFKVFGLNTSDGSFEMDEPMTEQVMSAVSIGPDKRLYVGTINTANGGNIWAFDIQSTLQQGGWSMRGGNLQGTNSQP